MMNDGINLLTGPKTVEDDGVVIAELQRRNAELESEIEQLRRHGRQKGNHEVLSVVTEVVVTTSVDLSRFDMSLVIQISSFLGTARGLLSLALTCRSFGLRQPTSAFNWSLTEEVARQEVCSAATDAEMSCLPQYVSGTATWLSILHRFEHLLIFDVLIGRNIEHVNGDKSRVQSSTTDRMNTAVSSYYVMRSGTHYAEFRITGFPRIGIVRPMPNLDTAAYDNYCFFVGNTYLKAAFLAQRSEGWSVCNVHACEYCCETGNMGWTDWDEEDNEEDNQGIEWDGMEECGTGDTVGLLLNLDVGTLTIYKNNRRLGVMKDGLSGSYCWYVSVAGDGGGVDEEREAAAIRRGTLLPL